MVGLVNDQSGKDMARRDLCLKEVATPTLAEGTEKTHKPQDTQPRSRNSNSAPPECTPEATAFEAHYRHVSQFDQTTDFSTFGRSKIVSA